MDDEDSWEALGIVRQALEGCMPPNRILSTHETTTITAEAGALATAIRRLGSVMPREASNNGPIQSGDHRTTLDGPLRRPSFRTGRDRHLDYIVAGCSRGELLGPLPIFPSYRLRDFQRPSIRDVCRKPI